MADLEYKDTLTNEQLLKRFKNQFELVRYAISLAENTIRSRREPDFRTDSQNVAYNILADIAAGKEQFADIPEPEKPQEKPRSESGRGTSRGATSGRNSSGRNSSGRTSSGRDTSWNEEVRALKEEKKERKSKAKLAR